MWTKHDTETLAGLLIAFLLPPLVTGGLSYWWSRSIPLSILGGILGTAIWIAAVVSIDNLKESGNHKKIPKFGYLVLSLPLIIGGISVYWFTGSVAASISGGFISIVICAMAFAYYIHLEDSGKLDAIRQKRSLIKHEASKIPIKVRLASMLGIKPKAKTIKDFLSSAWYQKSSASIRRSRTFDFPNEGQSKKYICVEMLGEGERITEILITWYPDSPVGEWFTSDKQFFMMDLLDNTIPNFNRAKLHFYLKSVQKAKYRGGIPALSELPSKGIDGYTIRAEGQYQDNWSGGIVRIHIS